MLAGGPKSNQYFAMAGSGTNPNLQLSAELRVLMAIVEIGGAPEVAPVLGISETTVKTDLQLGFEKTGTERQADLVKLVAGLVSPLA